MLKGPEHQRQCLQGFLREVSSKTPMPAVPRQLSAAHMARSLVLQAQASLLVPRSQMVKGRKEEGSISLLVNHEYQQAAPSTGKIAQWDSPSRVGGILIILLGAELCKHIFCRLLPHPVFVFAAVKTSPSGVSGVTSLNILYFRRKALSLLGAFPCNQVMLRALISSGLLSLFAWLQLQLIICLSVVSSVIISM